MNQDRRYVIALFLGIVLVPCGILLTDTLPAYVGECLASVGLILTVMAVWCHRGRVVGDTLDEHARDVCARAFTHSWVVTFVAMIVVFWLDYARLVPMRGAEAVGVLVVVLLVSAAAFRGAYRRSSRPRRDH